MLVNIKEAASQLNVKESWLRSQIFKKSIPYVKVGRIIRFDTEDLRTWLSGKKQSVSGGLYE